MFLELMASARAACTVALCAIAAIAPGNGRAQALRDSAQSPAIANALALRSVRAVRIVGAAPVIDGKLDEEIWRTAPIATDFVRSHPHPGTIAAMRTEARVAFDDDALYVALRMYDPEPGKILAPFPRRDDETTSDWVFVEIDSRHDHRTGFSFGVNPRGVQVDGTWANDVLYDASWNGVWQSAARIDSLGWTAEYRIPFSQIALSGSHAAGEHVLGLNIYRTSPHGAETSNWSPRLPTLAGIVSNFNELRGVELTHSSAQIEIVPYVGARTASSPARTGDVESAALPRGSGTFAGADARIALPGNYMLAATIRPDFGQVEADPSVVNLTSFESFFPEQRPFFLESADVFAFNEGVGVALPFVAGANSFTSENPFYSRRIGRAPHDATIPDSAQVRDVPGFTNIIGAAKLVGRSASGWTTGVLGAATESDRASIIAPSGEHRSVVVEPAAQFGVGRVSRDFHGGESALGAMITAVHRSETGGDSSGLTSSALFGGVDGRHRFHDDEYEASGFFTASTVNGSPNAIRNVELASDHYMFRPDAPHLRSFVDDSTRASLGGISAQARLAKLGGGHWRFSAIAQSISPGFEINDVGFQRNSDWLIALGTAQYVEYRPSRLFRTWTASVDRIGAGWSYGGERRAAVGALNWSGTFHNEWGISLRTGGGLSWLSTETLRGGPALLFPGWRSWGATVTSDSRSRKQLTIAASGFTDADGVGHGENYSANFDWRVTDRLRVDLAPSFSYSNEALQYVQTLDTSATGSRYVVGRLRQRTASLETRVDLAITQHATLQLYAQPLVGSAHYVDFAEVVSPRARSVSARVHPVDATDDITDPSFGTRNVLGNAVLRWEYRPGSALFVVFTQQRDADVADASWHFGEGTHQLWRVPASSVLLVKWSYWWTPGK